MNWSLYMSWTCAYITGCAGRYEETGAGHELLARDAADFAETMMKTTDERYPKPQLEPRPHEVV